MNGNAVVGQVSNLSVKNASLHSDKLKTCPTWRAAILFVCLLAIVLTGCGKPTSVNTAYGRRRGQGADSVNGTGVLARMFQNAGHRVVSRGRGAGQIDDCKVIVWAPNRFDPPSSNERQAIQTWIEEGYGRTFIYIGRDFDAGIQYWETTSESAPADGAAVAQTKPIEQEEYARRLAEARSRYETARNLIPDEENAAWFVVRRDYPQRLVDELSGTWSRDVDPAKAGIVIRSRFDIPTEQELVELAEVDVDFDVDDRGIVSDIHATWEYGFDETELMHEVLLAASPETIGGDDEPAPLVTRVSHPYWGDGAVIVITNGSILLNLPLVNHEHRKLAGYLIDECGYEPGKVAFWEADSFEPQAVAKQQDEWKILTIWPLNVIFLHLGVLGIVYVLWRFPIFGPAKDLPQTAASDFAKHINALGELMAATNEPGYARARLESYRANVRSDRRDAPSAADVTPLTKAKPADPRAVALEKSDAMIEYRNGNYDDAVRLVNRMIDEKPRDAALWQFKGECLFKLQRYDEALNCFQQVKAIGGPAAEEAFLWVSLCHHNAGRTNEAKDTIERFLADPGAAHPDLISKAKAALGKLQDGAAK